MAEAEARLLAHAAEVAANPPPAPPVRPPRHRLRVTLEIDGERRVFSAACIDGFGWCGDSGNTITKAIRLVMAAGAREEAAVTLGRSLAG